jgi:hypothetical protein
MTGMKHFLERTALTLGLALALSGCNGEAGQAAGLAEAGPDQGEASPAAPEAGHKMSTQDQVAFCRADLAERLEIEPDAVSLSGATPVTWRSGALGCPEPGMSYTQALVPGIWIMMKAGNKAYRYHAASNGVPFYCPDERAEPPVTGAGAD